MSDREARAMDLLEAMPVSDSIVEWPSANEAVAAMIAFADAELELAATYLDGYAGGHYMAKSCAQAVRDMKGE